MGRGQLRVALTFLPALALAHWPRASTVAAIVAPSVFSWLITVWLWLTVVFANLAEAVAEGSRDDRAHAGTVWTAIWLALIHRTLSVVV